ncbi:MAG: transporter ATP-binding protein [Frankiales bacterium]|nr:transporter ATP-binding protein [Frankiales bacterium]
MIRLTAVPLALLAALPVLAAVPTAEAAAPAYTMKALKLTVTVASESALSSARQTCIIDADLFTPAGTSKAHPAPAILATNGFGGSKADQDGLGAAYAKKGYVVLSYSGLGFGSTPTSPGSGSGCKITLDDREHDGAAGSQLIDFLGGIKKADDGTSIDYVKRDAVAHDGKAHPGDVRVGMVGGSYGGEIQFAVAGVDPRLDTIIPLITWNDLSYSLAPNNTSLGANNSVTYTTPGTEKIDWVTLFSTLGFADGLQGVVANTDPTRAVGCPNFADEACVAMASLATLGYPTDDVLAFARNASVHSYLDKITIPTLLGQGQADTLFNLHEATATYTALKARKVPVKMIWQQWGHSHGALPGEFDLTKPDSNYEGRVITQWFDHYLMDKGPAPALDFTYYQPWKDKGDAAKAFTSAPAYPLGGTTTLYGSGTALTPVRSAIVAATSTIAAPAGGVPLSYTETSALDQSQPVRDLPGATTTLSTGPLAKDLPVIGIPTATLQLSSPTASVSQAAGPAGQLVAFVKLYDVAPDGTIVLANRVISPIRVADISKPVEVTLPGTVHLFPKGHSLKLVVSLTDAAYKGNNLAQSLTLSTSKAAPTTLTLPGPVAAAGAAKPAAVPTPSAPGVVTSPGTSLPVTGSSTTLPLLGLAALALVAVRRRRSA